MDTPENRIPSAPKVFSGKGKTKHITTHCGIRHVSGLCTSTCKKTLKKTINSSRLYYCAIHWNGTIIKWHSAVLQGQRDPIALWLPISVKLFLDSICTCKLTGYITVCQVCSKQQKHTIIII